MRLLATNTCRLLRVVAKLRFAVTGLALIIIFAADLSKAAEQDLSQALRRAQYLLNATIPTDDDFAMYGLDVYGYQQAVREFIEHENFYRVLLRYHQRILGIGLPNDYIQELMREEIDNKQNKFASITCRRDESGRFRCYWSSAEQAGGNCPRSQEEPASVFWYPGVVAWVCPSVITTCGHDLSRCFVEYYDGDEARNSELGTTETFDSRYAVIRSLSLQAAGLATAVVVENYPYTTILRPGVTAVDGAITHFYRQAHHFRVDQLNLPSEIIELSKGVSLTDTRFRLINTGHNPDSGGVISTFGFMRRFEKNRSRANQIYERLLCRRFTSELPRVFPQDPGNLREVEGCNGCHATLDPMADFFATWGEGGELYQGHGSSVVTSFNNRSGSYVADLAAIVAEDRAFATCQVMHAWEWLMGRQFYFDEQPLRTALSDYFIHTNYSFKELVYAIVTHPAFRYASRIDGVVTDPLEEPPLGTAAGETQRDCDDHVVFDDDIAPFLHYCTSCHGPSSSPREDLSTEAQWELWASQAVNMMASGVMPPGQSGPEITTFTDNVRCWLEQE